MANAAVVYRSSTGTTRALALKIGDHLRQRGIATTVSSVGEVDLGALVNVDFLLTGCWTNGWLVIHQHPDEPWLAFARALPVLDQPRIALFTTYKVAVGGMFRQMREGLGAKVREPELVIASRGAHLNDAQRAALDRFVGFGE